MSAPTTARRSIAVIVILLGLAAALAGVWEIVAHDVGEGPVVVEVSAGRGLHRGEVLEVLLLLLGVALVGVGAWVGRLSR